jgi:hypothetical protein
MRSVTLTFDSRARMLVLVLVLVLAAGAAGLMVFKRLRSSSDASTPAPTTRTVEPRPPKPKVARRAPLTPQKPKPAPVAPSDQLPAAIRSALAANLVVVVALYDPKAKIDGLAVREARAGAELAGSSFVPIDVRKNGVDSLNARYGAIQDPAVLVLRPPGSLVVRIDGFADRDTVAQAAVNAAS